MNKPTTYNDALEALLGVVEFVTKTSLSDIEKRYTEKGPMPCAPDFPMSLIEHLSRRANEEDPARCDEIMTEHIRTDDELTQGVVVAVKNVCEELKELNR